MVMRWLLAVMVCILMVGGPSPVEAQSGSKRGSTVTKKKPQSGKSQQTRRSTKRAPAASAKKPASKSSTGTSTTKRPEGTQSSDTGSQTGEAGMPPETIQDNPPPVDRLESYASRPLERLFNGKDLSGWRLRNPDGKQSWKVENGELVNEGQGTDLVTEAKFTDFELHLEFNVPPGGNSGVYLQGRYEIQIADSAGQTELTASMLGAIYSKVKPALNAAKPAGEWQTLDVHFQQAVKDDKGKIVLKPTVTIILNDEIIVDRAEIDGVTGGALDNNEGTPGPLMLQGDHTAVRYRNILIRQLPPRTYTPVEEEEEVPPPAESDTGKEKSEKP